MDKMHLMEKNKQGFSSFIKNILNFICRKRQERRSKGSQRILQVVTYRKTTRINQNNPYDILKFFIKLT